MTNKCGHCKHAKPGDQLGQRVCMFPPPMPLLVPTGPNQAQVQFVRPLVHVNEDACGAGFTQGIYGVEGIVIDLPSTDINE